MTKKRFFSNFNSLIIDTMFQAIVTKKVHQIFFDFDHQKVMVKKHNSKIDEKNKHLQFEPVDKNLFNSQIELPQTLTVRNFFVEKKDEIKSGMKMHDAWFYIMPDGSSQPVVINIDDDSDEREAKFSISINPFYSQASLHDTFQKP